jgi:uncharacterized protein (TIGR03083 family)
MTTSPNESLADRIIVALRANHDRLSSLVAGLSTEDLAKTSGSIEWPVAQVLSHLGSGAEISRTSLLAALGSTPTPPDDYNQGVWDRWNAMGHAEQASSFVTANSDYLSTVESLTSEQRVSLPIPVSFMPTPMTVTMAAGMRLNEASQHTWDIEVAFDPAAEIDAVEATLAAELLSGELSFLLGYIGHADAASGPSTIALTGSPYAVIIGDSVSLTSSAQTSTATFVGPLPAAIRLTGGRLTPAHTAPDIAVTGNSTLDELRRVFPGT